MHKAIQAAQLNIYTEVLDELFQFVLKTSEFRDRDERGGEIPTAVLITGVNMPDHDTVFSTFRQLIMNSITPFVVSLSSRDSQSTKNIIQKIVITLMGHAIVEDDEVNLPKMKCTLPVLVAWYDSVVKSNLHCPSPTKKIKLGDSCPFPSRRTKCRSPKKNPSPSKQLRNFKKLQPIIIILEDFEKFQAAVVEDFILICSEYVGRLPLVFVFGVSTSVLAVHQILLQSSLSRLAMETFQSQSPSEYFNYLLNEVLLTARFPFKVSSRLFHFLEDIFLYNDLSVKTFLSGLKFCIMEYFYSSPLSVLCCEATELEGRIEELNDDALEELRKLMSFRKYVEGRPVREQKMLLQDDWYLKNVVSSLLTELHKYHSTFFPMLRVLYTFTKDLPKTSMGRQLRELYSICLENNIVDLEEFNDCLKCLRLLAKDELLLKLKSALDVLNNFDSFSTEKEAIKQLLENVNNLQERDDAANGRLCQTIAGNQKLDLYALQQKLKESGKRKRCTTAFEAWREEIVQLIMLITQKYLNTQKHFVLHEIMYFDNLKAVKAQLMGSPRSSIQIALSDPWRYLQCECCNLEEIENLVSSLPDICVCYKLHLECGRWINLYDWLQAFIAVVDPSSSDKKPSKQSTNKDRPLLARFVRSVAEMQFLGFVKPTPRKTDHVARLVW